MERRVRWVIMGFLCALFVMLAPALVLYAIGYRIVEGKLAETGLILLGSSPAGALVELEGLPTLHKTPAAISKPAPATYTATVRLAEHRPWSKTFAVKPQWVSRAENILLIPERLEAWRVCAKPVSRFALSQDAKFVVFSDTRTPPTLWMKNLLYDEDPVPLPSPTSGEIPADVHVNRIEIGGGGRAAIVTYGGGDEPPSRVYWLALREPYTLVRLDTAIPGASLHRIHPKAPHHVFVLAGDKLARFDTRERTLKPGLAHNVETFEITEDGLWLLKSGLRSVFVRLLGSTDTGDEKEVLSLPKSVGAVAKGRRLVVDLSRNCAVALGEGTSAVLLRSSATITELDSIVTEGRYAVFSPDRLRVAVATARTVQVFPAYPFQGLLTEPPRSQSISSDAIHPPGGQAGEIAQLTWLSDSAHLLVRWGQIVELMETDTVGGHNRHEILRLRSSTAEVAFDPKDSILYFTDFSPDPSDVVPRMFLYSLHLRSLPRGWLDWFSRSKNLNSPPTITRP